MMVNMEKYNCLQRMTGNIYEENRNYFRHSWLTQAGNY